MKRIFLPLILTGLSYAQVGPIVNNSSLTYFGFHYLTDVAPEPYSSFPNAFQVRPPQLPNYLPYKILLDINSIRIYINGKALTQRVNSNETDQTLEFQYFVTVAPFSSSNPSANFSQMVVIFFSPSVYHVGDRVRVDFGYAQTQ